jgi:hypothetical protein
MPDRRAFEADGRGCSPFGRLSCGSYALKGAFRGENAMIFRVIVASTMVVLATVLAGCMGNGYAEYYKATPGLSAEDVSLRRLADPPAEPELIRGNDPKADVLAAISEGYLVVGASSFNGPQATDGGALAHAPSFG